MIQFPFPLLQVVRKLAVAVRIAPVLGSRMFASVGFMPASQDRWVLIQLSNGFMLHGLALLLGL